MAGGCSGGGFSSRRDQLKVYFAAEGVDADNLDADGIAETEGAAMAASFDEVFLFVILVGVVFESGEAH